MSELREELVKILQGCDFTMLTIEKDEWVIEEILTAFRKRVPEREYDLDFEYDQGHYACRYSILKALE